jgi:hypothetical protein
MNGHLPLHRHTMPSTVNLDLPAGRAWSAPTPRGGIDIECATGALWITVQGDPEDHVLTAPGHFATSAPGRVAALALEPTHAAVHPAKQLS